MLGKNSFPGDIPVESNQGDHPMNCEKSRKRDLLKRWGLRKLSEGMRYETVLAFMRKHGRKTTAEIEQLVREA
jgi:hypothetical protein